MGCCDKPNSSDQLYVPLNRRLVQYAIDSSEAAYLAQFPTTKLFIFMFADLVNPCVERAKGNAKTECENLISSRV